MLQDVPHDKARHLARVSLVARNTYFDQGLSRGRQQAPLIGMI
jgi:hypothetical protein